MQCGCFTFKTAACAKKPRLLVLIPSLREILWSRRLGAVQPSALQTRVDPVSQKCGHLSLVVEHAPNTGNAASLLE